MSQFQSYIASYSWLIVCHYCKSDLLVEVISLAMNIYCNAGCKLLYEQTVMEVSEDAGEIELVRISKQGQTELPVTIYLSGSTCNTL